LVESWMLASTFSLVGEGLKPSATHIVIAYSQKLSRLDLNQALQWTSGYNTNNSSETQSAISEQYSWTMIHQYYNCQFSAIYLLFDNDFIPIYSLGMK
jgi:hypothetical protein